MHEHAKYHSRRSNPAVNKKAHKEFAFISRYSFLTSVQVISHYSFVQPLPQFLTIRFAPSLNFASNLANSQTSNKQRRSCKQLLKHNLNLAKKLSKIGSRNVFTHLVLKRIAKDLYAPEIDGAPQSFSEAAIFASLPADLAQAAATTDDQQKRHHSNQQRRPQRNCSANTRTNNMHAFIHSLIKTRWCLRLRRLFMPPPTCDN